MDSPNPRPQLVIQQADHLRHFSREGPLVKLAALLLILLPAILTAAGLLAFAVLKIAGFL